MTEKHRPPTRDEIRDIVRATLHDEFGGLRSDLKTVLVKVIEIELLIRSMNLDRNDFCEKVDIPKDVLDKLNLKL